MNLCLSASGRLVVNNAHCKNWQSLSALDFNFERAVEGSILTAGKNVESEHLNGIIRAIN